MKTGCAKVHLEQVKPRGGKHDAPMTERHGLTRNQTLVMAELETARGPLSAYTLLDRLREHGFRAPLQVYRALDTLVKAGLAHRLESLNAFVACAGAHPHEHGVTGFAICDRCGQVSEFADPSIGEQLESHVGATGFHTHRAVIEVRGLCGSCAAKAA